MRPDKKGTILITTLWILAILSVLAIGIGFRVSIEARLSKYNMDRLKGLYLAKAGIYKSQDILSKYPTKSSDSIRECGIVLSPNDDLKGIFTEKLNDGIFVVSYDEEGKNYYGMMDEERKININTAPPEVLENFLGMENEELTASIINWRGTAQMLKGASDIYYESLTPPYKCKHAPFSVIEELMLVKGMTPELFESIKDYITVYGTADGRVNINTATKRVMLACGLSDGLADIIIKIRNGEDKIAGTKDDIVFYGDIAEQLGLPECQDRAILGKYFTTVSNYFRIESKGMVDSSRITCKIVCIVKRGAKKLEYYREY